MLVPELTANLYSKSHLWVHYLKLKIALDKGFSVTEFGQTIWFRQDNIMKEFIDNVGKKRAIVKTTFEKGFYKLMGVNLYGSTLMDTSKFMNCEIVTSRDRYDQLIKSNKIRGAGKITNSMLCVLLDKNKTVVTRPIAIGASILGMSKWALYGFCYMMKDRYKKYISIAQVDTDAVTYITYNKVRVLEDIHNSFLEFKETFPEAFALTMKRESMDIREYNIVKEKLIQHYYETYPELFSKTFFYTHFDMNDFKKNMKQYWDEGFHKKWFHTMKFEHAGDPLLESNAPVTKVYADRYASGKYNNILKSVGKKEKNEQITFEEYRNCVLQGIDDPDGKIKHICALRHNRQLVTTKETKKTFTFFNPKVWIPENYNQSQGDYQTLSLGHFRCGKMYSLEEARIKNKQNEKEKNERKEP